MIIVNKKLKRKNPMFLVLLGVGVEERGGRRGGGKKWACNELIYFTYKHGGPKLINYLKTKPHHYKSNYCILITDKEKTIRFSSIFRFLFLEFVNFAQLIN